MPSSGLGLPAAVLVPTRSLIAVLRLRPGQHMTLDDDTGPGLALITWRTCYEHSSQHLAWPRVTGCAIIMRPDLMPQLTENASAPLVIRDFIVGDADLARETK